jgi:hypothetical protein
MFAGRASRGDSCRAGPTALTAIGGVEWVSRARACAGRHLSPDQAPTPGCRPSRLGTAKGVWGVLLRLPTALTGTGVGPDRPELRDLELRDAARRTCREHRRA